MVEVKHDLWVFPTKFLSIFHSTLSHVAKKCRVSIVASTLRYLKDHRRLSSSCSLDDSLKLLHIVEIECRDSISAFYCLCKHLASIHKA